MRLLKAQAAAADAALSSPLLSSQLLMELEASRDEGCRLRRELQGALQAGAAEGACVVGGSERERLRRELEIALKQGAEAAAAAAEARSRSARLQAELDAVLSEHAPGSAFTFQEVSQRAASQPPPVVPKLTPRTPRTVPPPVPPTPHAARMAGASATSSAAPFAAMPQGPLPRGQGVGKAACGETAASPCTDRSMADGSRDTDRGATRASDAVWRIERDRTREEAPVEHLRQSSQSVPIDELQPSGMVMDELRSSGEQLCPPEAPGTPPPRARGVASGSGLAPEPGLTASHAQAGDLSSSTKFAAEAAAGAASSPSAGTTAKLPRPPWELRHEYRHECGRLREKLAELRATFAAAGAAADAGAGLGQDANPKAAFGGLDRKEPHCGPSLFSSMPSNSGVGRHRSVYGGSACGAGEASRFSSWRRDPIGLDRLEQLWQRS